jgi:hypothetical protein
VRPPGADTRNGLPPGASFATFPPGAEEIIIAAPRIDMATGESRGGAFRYWIRAGDAVSRILSEKLHFIRYVRRWLGASQIQITSRRRKAPEEFIVTRRGFRTRNGFRTSGHPRMTE